MRSLSVLALLAACSLVGAGGDGGLKVGDRAPGFSLPAATRDSVLATKVGPADYAGTHINSLVLFR